MTSIPGDQRVSLVLLVAYGFGNAAAYVTSRVVADGLFLSHIGPQRLPAMYMVSAGFVALASIGYARLARRFQLHGVILACLAALALASVLLGMFSFWMPTSLSVFGLIYLASEVRGSLGTIHYATLINEKFAANVAPRVVGYVGFGATAAGVVVAATIGAAGHDIELESLLYVIAAIDGATMLPILILWQRKRRRAIGEGAVEAGLLDHPGVEYDLNLRDAARSRFVLGVAAIVVLGVVASRLVEFQWKAGVADWFQRDEHDLAAYFGFFYAVLYLMTGLVQLLATGLVLDRAGPLVGLLAFPATLVISVTGAILSGSARMLIAMFTLAKGCDTFKRALNDPAVQLLYLRLPAGLRRQSIAFVAGVVKPAAEGIAAAGLLVLASLLAYQQLSYVILVVLVGWLGAIALFRVRHNAPETETP